MNNPLVSIIVPVYNVQNSVARCLESICAQTWKDIEVILVNDGSRDESFPSVSNSVKGPPHRLVDNPFRRVGDPQLRHVPCKGQVCAVCGQRRLSRP